MRGKEGLRLLVLPRAQASAGDSSKNHASVNFQGRKKKKANDPSEAKALVHVRLVPQRVQRNKSDIYSLVFETIHSV